MISCEMDEWLGQPSHLDSVVVLRVIGSGVSPAERLEVVANARASPRKL